LQCSGTTVTQHGWCQHAEQKLGKSKPQHKCYHLPVPPWY
jgi:hypothetical protein